MPDGDDPIPVGYLRQQQPTQRIARFNLVLGHQSHLMVEPKQANHVLPKCGSGKGFGRNGRRTQHLGEGKDF